MAFLPLPSLPRSFAAIPRPQKCRSPRMTTASPSAPVKVAILGASGYTGAELLRILAQHPRAQITTLTAERSAGKTIGQVYPQFSYGLFASHLPVLEKTTDVQKWTERADVVFCCLPHATTQNIIASLPLDDGLRVVDLSADFRLRDVEQYHQWYGGEHQAQQLQKEAVYGITELFRDQVRTARLVANPGCYPTSAQLPLIPLLREKLILPQDIIIDAKSGTSGAGRSPKVGTLFCEVADGISAYGVARHRHTPEIEQGLSEAYGSPIRVSFTPHLMPMSRGILATIYVKLAPGCDAKTLRQCLQRAYQSEHFVHVLDEGLPPPQTRHVRGSNNCVIAVVDDAVPGRAILVSCIDNVVKGASGQAVQNMNVMMGLPESMGLENQPMFP
ncbi:putative N-acetyl-gamma-glutamyl-phosphate reductase, chloroplastic [Gracilariopsis chorda]|uniref:N-acetyl-gamma-glutamyl-phosphate reductase n=1 Tax=Gracilariopsis chorda TaxID=448386 RepID=A0A2V3IG93_9FLOR|nr:putative N-acetyl-gamma-glutamyl-phosphate reductase, chloroplastic [Gracilariopsis chorda]|eukprot:PXF41109.1 putative N-acetyl-gamma-glutamyl-phosphate reductase, chloroplastic [Gracilariopsis chorda]